MRQRLMAMGMAMLAAFLVTQPVAAQAPAEPAPAVTERVTVAVNAEGATVTLDGANVGATPLAVQHLAPGNHHLEVRRGREVVTRDFTVVAGQDTRINIALAEKAMPLPIVTREEGGGGGHAAAEDSPWYTRWYVIGGAAVVVAAAAVVIIVAASSGKDAGPSITVPPIQ